MPSLAAAVAAAAAAAKKIFHSIDQDAIMQPT